jgi:uncharacterized membrane protein
VKWDEAGGMVDLGSIVAGRSSRANAISANGSVIVGWQDEPTGTKRSKMGRMEETLLQMVTEIM